MRGNASRALVAAPVILLAALAPGAADAATYCVPAHGAATCEGDVVSADVSAAVRAADDAAGPDTVLIGAGLHDLGEGVSVGRRDTEVRGAGRDETILTADALEPTADFGRTVLSGWMPRLSDLTLRLPSAHLQDGRPGSVEGADVYDGIVERVRIDDEGAVFGPGNNDGSGTALTLRAGVVRDLEIDLAPGSDTQGVKVISSSTTGPTELEDVRISAPDALRISPDRAPGDPAPVVRVRRARLAGTAPLSVGSGAVELRDSAIVAQAPVRRYDDEVASAVTLYNGRSRDPSTLTLDRVTLVGVGGHANGHAETFAFEVSANTSSFTTTLRARHVLASGFDRTLLHGGWGGSAEATVEHSLLDVRGGAQSIGTTGDGRGALALSLANGNRSGAPRFVNAAAGDLRLRWGSPAIDVGGDELLAGEATDLGGAPRPADGDGDGAVAADAGAFEKQFVPNEDQLDPDPVPDPGPGPGPDPGPGPGPGPRPGPVCCSPPPDRVRPVVRRFALAPRRVAVGAPRGRRARAARFSFALSEWARVRIAVQRRRGTRWVAAGALKPVTLGPGRRSIAFKGRLAGRRRALAPGTYRAVLVATDRGGNRSVARSVRFAVVSVRAR